MIRDPAERQLAVDCLVVIYWMATNNPDVPMNDRTLDLLKILRLAIEEHWNKWVAQGQIVKAALDSSASTGENAVLRHALSEIENGFEHNELFARRLFFDLPSGGRDGSNSFLAAACIKMVFDEKLQLENYDIDADFCEFVPRVLPGKD